MLDRSAGSQDIFPNQDSGASKVHVPRSKRTKFFPSNTVQHSVHIQKVLLPAMSLLEAHNVGSFSDSFEVPGFVQTCPLAGGSRAQ